MKKERTFIEELNHHHDFAMAMLKKSYNGENDWNPAEYWEGVLTGLDIAMDKLGLEHESWYDVKMGIERC